MIVLYVVLAVVLVAVLSIFLKFFGLWFRALLSGAHISISRLIGMWIRRVKSKIIVDSRIMLVKAGIDVDSDLLETHYLAGGDVLRLGKALVAANKANIP